MISPVPALTRSLHYRDGDRFRLALRMTGRLYSRRAGSRASYYRVGYAEKLRNYHT